MAHLTDTAVPSLPRNRTARTTFLGLRSVIACILGRLGCQTVQL
jgi:hypothetical protein